MNSETIAAPRRARVDWRRAEFVLTLLAFVGFITLPLRIDTVYSGLPAHPLFVHVPVILIPTTIVAAIVFVIKPQWLTRYGIALALASIVAMSSVFLAMQAGAALRRALNLQGPAAKLISEHSQAAHILAIVYVLFTATLIVTFAAQRISGGMPTGLGVLDRLLSPRTMLTALRVVLVLLAVVAGYMCFRTGDLGAKAVWEGRVQAAHVAGPGGPGPQRAPQRFVITRLPVALPVALQDTAAVPLGSGRAALLGGLNAADTSTTAVSVLDARGVRAGARLPEAQHDAQGVLLDGRPYVFGGGQFSSYDHILSYDPTTDSVTQAGSLPTPTSDAAVAALAGTAYIVGGYDGQQALDTIIAWRPAAQPELVARLPYGLRYAAVAASDGQLLIVGGSHDEAATTTILSFDPATHKVQHIGDLPSPITHAAAIALGSYVYTLGGRGSAPGTQSAAIVAIDPATGHSVRVGRLPQSLSDAAAISFGDRVWLAGGLSTSGPVDSVLELTPRPL